MHPNTGTETGSELGRVLGLGLVFDLILSGNAHESLGHGGAKGIDETRVRHLLRIEESRCTDETRVRHLHHSVIGYSSAHHRVSTYFSGWPDMSKGNPDMADGCVCQKETLLKTTELGPCSGL